MICIRALAAAVALILIMVGPSARAEPRNLRAFCVTHKTFAGPGESGTTNREVISAGGNTWRCMNGRVLVCNLGASGASCERTAPYDADRRRAFTQFCRENAGSDIPNYLARGLASAWRCNGTHPARALSAPTDRLGYLVGAWKPLR